MKRKYISGDFWNKSFSYKLAGPVVPNRPRNDVQPWEYYLIFQMLQIINKVNICRQHSMCLDIRRRRKRTDGLHPALTEADGCGGLTEGWMESRQCPSLLSGVGSQNWEAFKGVWLKEESEDSRAGIHSVSLMLQPVRSVFLKEHHSLSFTVSLAHFINKNLQQWYEGRPTVL